MLVARLTKTLLFSSFAGTPLRTSTSSWSLGLVRGGGGGSGAGAVAAAASDKGSGAKGGGAGGSSGWDSSHLRKDSDSFDEKGGPLDGSKYAELQAALNMLQVRRPGHAGRGAGGLRCGAGHGVGQAMVWAG